MRKIDKLKIFIVLITVKIFFKFNSFNFLLKSINIYRIRNLRISPHYDNSVIHDEILSYKKMLNLNCFQIAISLSQILRMLKKPHRLLIGTKIKNQVFKSHAWLELADFKIESEGFKEIYSCEY